MSHPKKLSENKEWVLIGHYAEAMEKVAALQAENERLRKAAIASDAVNKHLHSMVSEMRKAGDAMDGVLGLPINDIQRQVIRDAWLAAKGVQS